MQKKVNKIKAFIKLTLKNSFSLCCIGCFPANNKLSQYISASVFFGSLIVLRSQKNADFFFIQIGSNDGVSGDPINSYVTKYKWAGILVEPVRYLFQELIKNYRGENNLVFENVAIASKKGFKRFYFLKKTADSLPWWYKQLGSFSKKQLLKHKKIPNIKKYIVAEKVRTIRFMDLIQKYSVNKIDLLHIDVEGYDYEILKLINFDEIKPKMILFEHKHLSNESHEESQDLLKKNGYMLCRFGIDTFAYQPLSFLDRVKLFNLMQKLHNPLHKKRDEINNKQ